MLSAADKAWIRRMVRHEFRAVIEEMIAEERKGESVQYGGYDGATRVTDDDWAEEGRIGFRHSSSHEGSTK